MSVSSPTAAPSPPIATAPRATRPATSVRDFQLLASQARTERWSHEAYLATVLARQLADQESEAAALRIRAAGFPAAKTLADFDYDRLPDLDRELIDELATGGYLSRAENLALIGPTGTGKTHLAIGLGRKALDAGHTVRFDTAAGWIDRLTQAQDAGQLAAELKRLRRYRLIIIDQVDFLPASSNATNLLFQLVAERYEQGSILVTASLPLGRWDEAFGESAIVAALVDRLAHHAETITLDGQSYRTRARHALHSSPA